MRTYLVVMDETEEAKQALRFASLRAHKTGGSVHILALVPQQTFNAFGGVQAKSVVHAIVASIVGDTHLLASAGAEHQGPPGTNLICVITEAA